MDLIVIIVQVIKDLLGNVNPFRLLNSGYRAAVREHWSRSRLIHRIGYVLGIIGATVLALVALLGIWQFLQ